MPRVQEKSEPNLTPILDMVFQLITFFMLVINFKAAELDLSLQLPVLASARPLPEPGSNLKMLVLNVNVCTPCPHTGCDAYATLHRIVDEGSKKVKGYELVCERGHKENWPQGAITNGKICLSIYGRLLCKDGHGKDTQTIDDYVKSEADLSLMAAKLTRDEVVHEGKELPDIVVIRADTTCPFRAVNYIVTECQLQGYRKFALKTFHANQN